MKINLNIEEFLQKFRANYHELYEANAAGAIIAGQREATAAFDAELKNESFKSFVRAFVKYRGDFISSDREAAAFMLTLSDMTN